MARRTRCPRYTSTLPGCFRGGGLLYPWLGRGRHPRRTRRELAGRSPAASRENPGGRTAIEAAVGRRSQPPHRVAGRVEAPSRALASVVAAIPGRLPPESPARSANRGGRRRPPAMASCGNASATRSNRVCPWKPICSAPTLCRDPVPAAVVLHSTTQVTHPPAGGRRRRAGKSIWAQTGATRIRHPVPALLPLVRRLVHPLPATRRTFPSPSSRFARHGQNAVRRHGGRGYLVQPARGGSQTTGRRRAFFGRQRSPLSGRFGRTHRRDGQQRRRHWDQVLQLGGAVVFGRRDPPRFVHRTSITSCWA